MAIPNFPGISEKPLLSRRCFFDMRIVAQVLQYVKCYKLMCYALKMVDWKLRSQIEALELNPHQVAVAAGIHPPSFYRLIRDDGAKNVSRETLSRIISALRSLTDKPVSVCDLLEYTEDS
jgi:predicted transcriptional regulator